MGITNTIGRAELAAITAAIFHGHSHNATDSVFSLHQIKKHLPYPELHRHHVQGVILKMLKQAIGTSPNPVHLFKVKSHAGIAGDECADAVAKYQATQVNTSYADTGMPCTSIGGNPFYDITWLALERNTPLDAKILRSSDPLSLKLQLFSNL